MPRTVDEGFRDFLKKLTPSSYESDAAKRHRASIEQCIKSNFGIRRFWRTESFGNGTSISVFSKIHCQRMNSWWDVNLRRSWSKVLKVSFWIFAVSVLCLSIKASGSDQGKG